VELLGASDDQRFYRFAHCLYKANGELAVYSELLFGWMDLGERKLRVPPDELLKIFANMPKAEQYQPITKEEMRSTKVPFGRKLEVTA
jgi:acyl-CoA thioester hydrolase